MGCSDDDAENEVGVSGAENSAVLCSDGADNDGDGATDCDDAECLSQLPCAAQGDGDTDTDTDADGDLDQFVENPGAHCPVPSTEWDQTALNALPEISAMPDPFTMIDGTPVTSRQQWVCRRAEIAALLQKWEVGNKPAKPASVTGSMSGDRLTVNIADGTGKSLSFFVDITYPSVGSGPYPALIGLAGGNLPRDVFLNLGVAIITYDHDSMGNQTGLRGVGQFFDFNGDVDAGALLAWSWGASRLIDALEVTPEANLDPTRLAVNGCSRNGKGALMIGALDHRIALTLPQESGSGGVASWRVSEEDADAGGDIQTLRSASTEQPWFRKNLSSFGSYVNRVPIDHHEVMGLVAPRGLLVLGNVQFEWLGRNSCDQSVSAARLIYTALGVPGNIGHTETSHGHCQFPEVEIPALEAFIKKFLLNQEVNTDYWQMGSPFEQERWAPWTVPSLQ